MKIYIKEKYTRELYRHNGSYLKSRDEFLQLFNNRIVVATHDDIEIYNPDKELPSFLYQIEIVTESPEDEAIVKQRDIVVVELPGLYKAHSTTTYDTIDDLLSDYNGELSGWNPQIFSLEEIINHIIS